MFDKKDVKLISSKEKIDTATATGKMLITVLSAISQFERDIIVERTKEGLKVARARGRKGGRPKLPEKMVEKAVKLYKTQEYSVREITDMTGVSKTTLYRYLRD